MNTAPQIRIAANEQELVGAFVGLFVDSYSASVSEQGKFAICLSGGSTPRKLYQRLVDVELDWSKAFFFFGDERFVPPDHADSNFRMANEAMFLPLAIAEGQIHRWRTELVDADAAAADYSEQLKRHFGGMPRFDLCMLGLGTDAHTASLFPRTPALRESSAIAVANPVPKLETVRLTLTPAAINNSRSVLFVATGSDKAEAVRAVLSGDRRPEDLPAQLIEPRSGDLTWLLDTAAASAMKGG